ncbi:MAG: hypothetical protein ACREBI_02925 [Nitrosotalea sp.]
MSDFGIFASRLQINNKSLREFENALRYLRLRKRSTVTPEHDVEHIKKITDVMDPIVENLHGNLSKSMLIDDHNVVEILYRRKAKDWSVYKEELIKLSEKLSSKNLEVNSSEMSILNDVADAMEIECSKLFKRMGRFP